MLGCVFSSKAINALWIFDAKTEKSLFLRVILYQERFFRMKKKTKEKKKQDMPEFHFKQFTPEEDTIYEEAVNRFRDAVASGKTIRQAFESHTIADTELRSLVQADFLKIMIAERHFAQRHTLEEVAQALDVPLAVVTDTYKRMLQEVGVTAANQFGQEYGGIIPKTND
jgi:hypothetical protein